MSAPRTRRRVTIRFRLGLALALALLPVLALGSVDTYQDFHRDAEQRRESLSLAAGRVAAGARGRVRSAVALLQALSPQTVGLSCAHRLADALEEIKGYENLVRLDVDARVACAAASVGPDPGRRTSAWFSRLAAGADVAIAPAPPGVYGRGPAMLAATAVRSRGRFSGALVAVLDEAAMHPDISDFGLPADTRVSLLDADGRTVASVGTVHTSLPPGWKAKATSPRGLIFVSMDGDGKRRVHAVTPLLDHDGYALLSSPAPSLLWWARVNPFASVILPLLAWLLAWAAVWVVTERVVIRWLAYLERIAAIYAKGRFTVRPVQAENAPEEIRALAHTLDVMADGLVTRDLSLRESLARKDAMMREIHHRVKNNLQVITSLLNMQQRSLTDPAARAAMSDTRQRINALALIYRALYQSPDLRRVDVRQFLEELTAQLTAGEGGACRVRTELDADDLEIDPDKLAPLALFTVEAITNARKHAFDESGGLIRVRFRVEERDIRLEISDDGRGVEGDIDKASGVGRTLMTAFARQLRGSTEIGPGPERGVTVRLVFPKPDAPVAGSESPTPARGNQAAA